MRSSHISQQKNVQKGTATMTKSDVSTKDIRKPKKLLDTIEKLSTMMESAKLLQQCQKPSQQISKRKSDQRKQKTTITEEKKSRSRVIQTKKREHATAEKIKESPMEKDEKTVTKQPLKDKESPKEKDEKTVTKKPLKNKESQKEKHEKTVTKKPSKDKESPKEKDEKTVTKKPLKDKETFPEYIPLEEIREILKDGSKADAYIEGYLRINPKFYANAYLDVPSEESDMLIIGLRDRNRALEGDLVIARVNPSTDWRVSSTGRKQKTGTVVCIVEKVHSRHAIGCLKQYDKYAVLQPRDKRIPLLRIYLSTMAQYSTTELKLDEHTLFLAKIVTWKKPQYAVGRVIQMIGQKGDLEAEANAILLEHNINVEPYSVEVTKGLPDKHYLLTESDLKDREDWREECVFTIDPATAVDLDDAVSCKSLENGNYQIGVHISDVTHYLKFLSPLDLQVAKRATTVYMANTAYHMLPKQLCEVCSLLPGEDRLAFSVIFEMTESAEVVKHRFSKTVINSCCQMSYQHAQMFIENSNSCCSDDSLKVKGNFTVATLSETVNNLHKLAEQMRTRRFENGALQIDQAKLLVAVDKETGLPTSYSTEERKDSNRLIEEFMLLANMTVATHLYDTVPERGLLRNHKEPSKYVLNSAKETLQTFGIHLDIESAGSLQTSIKRYELELEPESEEFKTIMQYRMMVVKSLCSKAMTRATYRCLSTVDEKEELWHYGLNVPLYTHFTSPIRRYADCVVHRLLHSTIQSTSLLEKWSEELCTKIAKNCNLRKYNARVAQEQSIELYFAQLVSLNGPFVTVGIVLHVKESSIDVILCKIGIKLRIYLKDLENVKSTQYSTECLVPTISINWEEPDVTQVVEIFTLLHLRVEKHPEHFRLVGVLLPSRGNVE